MTQAAHPRIMGWKRIAAHLGVSERTARRWETNEGLPVHRQQHEARSTPFAYAEEIDSWLEARSPNEAVAIERTAWQPGTWAAGLALCLALAAAFLVFRPASPEQPPALSADAEAVELYERGTALWQQRGREPVARSIKLFTAAVQRDENFAEAWGGLAKAWATYRTYDPTISEGDAEAEVVSAATRALALKPELADVRALLVSAAYRKGDWLEAERLYREALKADPQNPDLLLWYAGHFRDAGLFDRAQSLTKQALELAPQSPPILTERAMNTLHLGDLAGGEAQLDYIWTDLGFRAPVVWFGKFAAMAERNDIKAMKAFADQSPFADKEAFRLFAQALEENTPASRARFLRRLEAQPDVPPWLAIHLLLELGMENDALSVAEEAAASSGLDNDVVLFNPQDAPMRDTARFARLVESIGLVEYWQVRGAPTFCEDEPRAPVCRELSQYPDRKAASQGRRPEV